MSNPKRNDPCPCGSGKKYKKCCGMSNVIEISPQLYNDELGQLHDDLSDYALGNHEDLFMEQTRTYFQPPNDDIVASEDYLTGLTLWTILNVPLLENKRTIFDAFYNQRKNKIRRTRTRNTFLEWANTVPSVYQVLAVNSDQTDLATLIDISTNEKFQVYMVEEDEYLEGSILIGILVPFVGFHHFFFDVIELFEEDKKEIISLLGNYPDDQKQFNEVFLDFLAEVLQIDEDSEPENPLHHLVIKLFTEHMSEKGFDDKIIDLGINIWQTYIQIKDPNFKKAEAYAAALEYLIQITVLENHTITQKNIAEEYGTTAGTVSTNYRKIINSIEESIVDFDAQPSNHQPVNMERDMREIQQILAEEEFDSMEEANDFINQMLNNENGIERTSMSPRDQAQDLLFDAQGMQGLKRRDLIKEALTIYPNSPDAYLLLAEDAISELEFGNNLKKAVQVGEKDLGKAFFLENKGHFWLMIETRPYMRAKSMLADFLYETGAVEEAFKEYEEMLRLNPSDNQGIRYILLTLYIESAQFKKAQQLINDFSDEGTASFLFNKVLVEYVINGLTSQTRTFIKEANKQNPFVKKYLLDKKNLPNEHLDHMGFGDETEAIIYAQENIHIWETYPELLKEL